MRWGRVMRGVQEYSLDSWREFHELCEKVFLKGPAYIFRGQARYDWPLRSTFDRWVERYPKRKNLSGGIPDFFECPPYTPEQQLNAFKRAVTGMRGPNPRPLTDEEYWSLGQHYGLKTPLLDWTRSPFSALFFAFAEESLQGQGGPAGSQERGVYALGTGVFGEGAPVGQKDAHLRIVWPLMDDNPNLAAQAALHLWVFPGRNVEQLVQCNFEDESHQPVLTKVKIPSSDQDRLDCLAMLQRMNITYLSLFPDLRGAAQHVNFTWQPGLEELGPYIPPSV
jgi:hypothetical protein